MRESIRRVEPVDQHLNHVWIQSLPEGVELERVCRSLATLAGRHESLRTRYDVDESGNPTQEVVAQGTFVVDVDETGDADPDHWSALAMRALRDHRYDLKEGPLMKAVVACRDGRPHRVAIGLSHMVADGLGLRAFRKELAALLNATAEGTAPAYAGAWQPSDQLRHERTPAAVRHGERCLAHHAERFGDFPSTMFWRKRERAETPRYRSGTLHSPALLPAVAAIYKAHGVTPSSAIFAAFSLVIGELTLHDANSMFLIYSNRDHGNMDSVANYSQTVPISVGLRTTSFWGLLKDTHRAMLNAYRHASYPPQEQRRSKAAVGNARGITILEDCVYNPRWWATGPELEAHAESGPDGGAPAPPSTFVWNAGADRGLALYFGVRRNTLALTADTKFVALDAFEPALRRVEALVLRGASEDFDPSVPVASRRPGAPDRDWVFVDGCWVDLDATRRMVAETTAGAEAVELSVVSGRDGRECLSCRISGAVSAADLEGARERCLRVLPRWRSAMVPQRFTGPDGAAPEHASASGR